MHVKTVCTFRLQSVERPAEGHAIISYSNKEGETRKDGRKESEASKASEVCSPGRNIVVLRGWKCQMYGEVAAPTYSGDSSPLLRMSTCSRRFIP